MLGRLNSGKEIRTPNPALKRQMLNLDMTGEEAKSNFEKLTSTQYGPTDVRAKGLRHFSIMKTKISGHIAGDKRMSPSIATNVEIPPLKLDQWHIEANEETNAFSADSRLSTVNGHLLLRPKRTQDVNELLAFTCRLVECIIVMSRDGQNDYPCYMIIGTWIDNHLRRS